MSTTDQSVTPILLDLLGCLSYAVAELERPPRNVSLRPGSVVELLLATTRDECCEGTAWVRPVSFFPSTQFPAQDNTVDQCGPVQFALTVELGVARCAPRPGPNTIPSADDWNALTLQVQDDAAAIRRAVCCFTALHHDKMVLDGPWVPGAVEGGCVGGAQTLTIAIQPCDCEDDTTGATGATVHVATVDAGWG